MLRKHTLISEEEFKSYFKDEELTDLQVTEMIASLEQFAKLTFEFIAMKSEANR